MWQSNGFFKSVKVSRLIHFFSLLIILTFCVPPANAGYTCSTKTYTSCSSNYYLSGGGCYACSGVGATDLYETSTISCSVTNGTGTCSARRDCGGNHTGGAGGTSGSGSCTGCSSWGGWYCTGTCTVQSCNSGYHTEDGVTCVSNTGSCPSGYSGSSTWNGSSWDYSACYKSCTKTCSGNDTGSCPANATCTYNTSSYTTGTQYYGGSCGASSSLCPVSSSTCNNGYHKSGNSCVSDYITVSCSAGYYIKKGSTSCNTACPAGKYCSGSSYSSIYYSGATADTGITGNVSAGYYSSGGGKTKAVSCLSGYSCGACDTGEYSSAGASSCSSCTNKPSNSHYTGNATGNSCPWECDDGYTKSGDSCVVSTTGSCPPGYSGSAIWMGSGWDYNACYRSCITRDVLNSTSVSGTYYYNGNNNCEATVCADGYFVTDAGLCGSSNCSQFATLNHSYYGGSGGTSVIYTDGVNYYSDSDCSDTHIEPPSKPYATYGGAEPASTTTSWAYFICILETGEVTGMCDTGTWRSLFTCDENGLLSTADCPSPSETTPTVELDKQGGTGGADYVTPTYGQNMPFIATPTREGSWFAGYYDGSYGTGLKYYHSDGTSARIWNKAYDTVLYAHWITCDAGYYPKAGVCVPCGDNNYYCNDGVRKEVTSGYYSTGGDSTTRSGQSQCTSSTWCSGGVKHNCPDDFTKSARGATSINACYKECSVPCTQPECTYENATCAYSDTPITGKHYYGGSCDAAASACDIVDYLCNSGYNKTFDGVCALMCTAGVTTLRTGTGVVVPLYAEKLTTPAINIRTTGGEMCYANLSEGSGDSAINVKYNDITYHTVD